MRIIKVLLVFLLIFSFPTITWAQDSGKSNSVTTKVGDPKDSKPGIVGGGQYSCPIPKGVVSCGSKFTPKNNCGHCGIGYDVNAPQCAYDGTKYAIDIAGSDGQDVILPSLNGHTIIWTYRAEEIPGSSGEAIQKYTGVDQTTNDQYYLQFHHTQPGSGRTKDGQSLQSGEAGGKICNIINGRYCAERHVHVQIGGGGSNQGNTKWLDVATLLCN